MESVRTRLGLTANTLVVTATPVVGKPVAATVRSVRARDVVADVPRAGAPLLPLDAPMRLTFGGGGLLRPYDASARVEAWDDAGDVRTFLFAPEDPERFELEFVEPFHRGDLRRKMTRLQPDPNEPPTTTVAPAAGGRPVEGRIVDLSIDGTKLHVAIGLGAELASADRVRIALTPPGAKTSIDLVGEVRHAHRIADLFSFGVRFVFDSGRTSVRSEDELTAYVMKLQQRLLATRSARPEGAPE